MLNKIIEEQELLLPYHSSVTCPTYKRVGHDSVDVPQSRTSEKRGFFEAWLITLSSNQVLPHSLGDNAQREVNQQLLVLLDTGVVHIIQA